MSLSDFSDVNGLSRDLIQKSDALAGMTLGVAKARQCLEFDSDRRKSALSRAVLAILKEKPDLSTSAAEHAARASVQYEKDMAALAKDYIAAEGTLKAWEVTKIQWQTAQSLLSLQKASMQL